MLKGLIDKIEKLPIGKKEVYEDKVFKVVNEKFPNIAKKFYRMIYAMMLIVLRAMLYILFHVKIVINNTLDKLIRMFPAECMP